MGQILCEEISFSRRAFFFLVVSSETAFLAPLCRVVGRVFVSTDKEERESLFFEEAQTRSFSSAFLARRRCTSFLIKEQLFLSCETLNAFSFGSQSSREKSHYIKHDLVVNARSHAQTQKERARAIRKESFLSVFVVNNVSFLFFFITEELSERVGEKSSSRVRNSKVNAAHVFVTHRDASVTSQRTP